MRYLRPLLPAGILTFIEYSGRFHERGFHWGTSIIRALSARRREELVRSGVELMPSWLTEKPLHYVIDVGANVGQFLSSLLSVTEVKQIDCFEPNPEALDKLKVSFSRRSRLPTIRTHNIAVGERTGVAELKVTSSSDFSSMLEPLAPLRREFGREVEIVKRVTVPIRCLDDCAQPDAVDLVKLDVQGFERQVIRGAAKVLARTRVLMVEVSFRTFYDGDSTLLDLMSDLANLHGFYLYNISNVSRDRSHRAEQADAVFVRLADLN